MTTVSKILILIITVVIAIYIYYLYIQYSKKSEVDPCAIGYYHSSNGTCSKCIVCKSYEEPTYICDGKTFTSPICKRLTTYVHLVTKVYDEDKLSTVQVDGRYASGLSDAMLVKQASTQYMFVNIPSLAASGLVYGKDYKYVFNTVQTDNISISFFDQVGDEFRFKIVSRDTPLNDHVFEMWIVPITERDIYLDLLFEVITNNRIQIVDVKGMASQNVTIEASIGKIRIDHDTLTTTIVDTLSYDSNYKLKVGAYTSRYVECSFVDKNDQSVTFPSIGSQFRVIVKILPNGLVNNVI